MSEKVDWMERIGYRRVVRRGPLVVVAGCGPVGPDGLVVSGTAYDKARRCLEVVRLALEDVGASLDDVVRTRVYLHDTADWEAAGEAHGDVFREIRPVTTMVGATLLDPAFRVEVDATAWVGDA